MLKKNCGDRTKLSRNFVFVDTEVRGFVPSQVSHCPDLGICHRPPQNRFRERKVYHNFVLILYNLVQHSLLYYRQFKFGGLVTCSPRNAVSTLKT